MAKTTYKRIYSIMRSCGKTKLSCHLVKETKKTYLDVTHDFLWRQGHRPYDVDCKKVIKSSIPYIGYRLLKSNEYLLTHDKYWIFMFGSDINELKKKWKEVFTPTVENEDDFRFDSGTLNHYAKMLNEERMDFNGTENY